MEVQTPGFGAVLRREWGRIVRQPLGWLMLGLLPVGSFLLFAELLSEGVARNIPIAAVDEDHTTLSRQLLRMIDATPTARIAYEPTDMIEAERLMRLGRIMAIVQVPARFQQEILGNTQTHLRSYITGTNLTANGLLAKDIQTAVTTFSAGIQISLLTARGLTERQAMAQLQPVRFDKHVLFNPYINYGYYLGPSFLPMMLLVFTILSTIYALGSELKYRTAGEWLSTAGGSIGVAVAGKLLPTTVAMFLLSEGMFFLLFHTIGVPLNGSLALLSVGNLLFILSYQSIGLLIVALMSNLRLSLSLGGGYSVLAFSFSGLTFPLMAMYPAMQALSRIFPFTYYTDLILDQALRGAPVVDSLPRLGALLLFILLPLLALPRLHKISSDPHYWGRL